MLVLIFSRPAAKPNLKDRNGKSSINKCVRTWLEFLADLGTRNTCRISISVFYFAYIDTITIKLTTAKNKALGSNLKKIQCPDLNTAQCNSCIPQASYQFFSDCKLQLITN